MLIETTQLPAEIQEQILELVKKGEVKGSNIDGLKYERAIRAE